MFDNVTQQTLKAHVVLTTPSYSKLFPSYRCTYGSQYLQDIVT